MINGADNLKELRDTIKYDFSNKSIVNDRIGGWGDLSDSEKTARELLNDIAGSRNYLIEVIDDAIKCEVIDYNRDDLPGYDTLQEDSEPWEQLAEGHSESVVSALDAMADYISSLKCSKTIIKHRKDEEESFVDDYSTYISISETTRHSLKHIITSNSYIQNLMQYDPFIKDEFDMLNTYHLTYWFRNVTLNIPKWSKRLVHGHIQRHEHKVKHNVEFSVSVAAKNRVIYRHGPKRVPTFRVLVTSDYKNTTKLLDTSDENEIIKFVQEKFNETVNSWKSKEKYFVYHT